MKSKRTNCDYVFASQVNMPPKRFYTLKEAVEQILADSGSESDDTVPEIGKLPPEIGAETENEEINERGLGSNEPGDVCGELDVFTAADNVDNEATISYGKNAKNERQNHQKENPGPRNKYK